MVLRSKASLSRRICSQGIRSKPSATGGIVVGRFAASGAAGTAQHAQDTLRHSVLAYGHIPVTPEEISAMNHVDIREREQRIIL
jgi:hypothetical protein